MHKAERPFGAFFHGEFEDNFDDELDDKNKNKFDDHHMFTNHKSDFMRFDDVQFDFFYGLKCKTLCDLSYASRPLP